MPGLEDMKSQFAPVSISKTNPEGRHEKSPFIKGGEDSLGGESGLEKTKKPLNGVINNSFLGDGLAKKK